MMVEQKHYVQIAMSSPLNRLTRPHQQKKIAESGSFNHEDFDDLHEDLEEDDHRSPIVIQHEKPRQVHHELSVVGSKQLVSAPQHQPKEELCLADLQTYEVSAAKEDI